MCVAVYMLEPRAHDSVCAGALRCESELMGELEANKREMASTSCPWGRQNGPLRPGFSSPVEALMLWFPREWGPQ